MKIGEFVLESRKQLKLTQEGLANKAGLARSFIARLERGDFEGEAMSLSTFIRLSKALSIPMYQLFRDIEYSNLNNLPPLAVYLRKPKGRKASSHRKA